MLAGDVKINTRRDPSGAIFPDSFDVSLPADMRIETTEPLVTNMDEDFDASLLPGAKLISQVTPVKVSKQTVYSSSSIKAQISSLQSSQPSHQDCSHCRQAIKD